MAQNWVATGRKRLLLGAIDALVWPLDAMTRLVWHRSADVERDPRKILVLEFWRLGDAVLAEPFLRVLRERFPAAEISLLCREATRTLLQPSGVIDRFIVADIPWTASEHKYALHRYRDTGFSTLLRQLRAERFDVTIDARIDLRSNLLTRFTGARRRIGFDAPGGRSLLTDRVPAPVASSHKVEDWLAMLTPLGGRSESSSSGIVPKLASKLAPKLVTTPEAHARAERFFSEAGIGPDRLVVAIHPSAWSPVRRWPLARFAAVVQALTARDDVQVLLVNDPDGYAAELGQISGVVVTRPSLEDLVAQLARCQLFVGNDSGPAHIAAAVGVPTVTIFGPQVSLWYRPYGDNHRVVQIDDVPCRACFDRCTQAENFCITGISVSRVLVEIEAAIQSLSERGAVSSAERDSGAVDLMPAAGEIPG